MVHVYVLTRTEEANHNQSVFYFKEPGNCVEAELTAGELRVMFVALWISFMEVCSKMISTMRLKQVCTA
eukprot:1584754-Karenia_brevis.AAC.1